MAFWWFMLVCGLLTPAVMIAAGYIMRKHCPRTINALIGYRTRRSMRSMDTWRFAHEHCGRTWWRLGWLLLLLSALAMIPWMHSADDAVATAGVILVGAQCVALILSILPTERALKRAFHEDGTRRHRQDPMI